MLHIREVAKTVNERLMDLITKSDDEAGTAIEVPKEKKTDEGRHKKDKTGDQKKTTEDDKQTTSEE